MENVTSFFSENKNSTYNEKSSRYSSQQALTYFSFSEFLSSDFRHNKFLQFLMENNMVKFHGKSEDKNSKILKLVKAWWEESP
jgi:hypothetical protein